MAEFFGLGAVPFDIGRQPMKQWHISLLGWRSDNQPQK